MATSLLPQGWAEAKLGDMVHIAYGKNLPVKRLTQSGYPVFGANGQIGWYTEFTHKKSEVLMTCRGATCGTINVSLPNSFITNNSLILSSFHYELLDFRFLFFLMKAVDKTEVISGSAQPQITIKDLEQLSVHIPPVNEQLRIADNIEELQAKTANARKALEGTKPLLEQYRQSILAAAFRGDLTATWREQNKDVEPASELLKRIRAERRTRWEEAELAKMREKGKEPKNDKWKIKYKEPEPVNTEGLPELPEGWGWVSPAEVALDVPNSLTIGPFGSNLKTNDYRTSGVPLVFVRDIRAEQFGLGKTVYIDEQKAHELKSHSVKGGDLLITKMGDPPGDTAVYPKECPTAVITADCIKLTPEEQLTSSKFLYYVIRGQVVASQFASITKGVAQQKVSLARFKTISIPLPPLQEQRYLINKLDNAFAKVEAIQSNVAKSLEQVGMTDQAILAKAFRGELVPQDPADEPATVLLKNIAAERAELKKTTKRTSRKQRKVKNKVDDKSLLKIIHELPSDSFTFEELTEKVNADYELVKDALFKLLESDSNELTQVFDEDAKMIKIKKG